MKSGENKKGDDQSLLRRTVGYFLTGIGIVFVGWAAGTVFYVYGRGLDVLWSDGYVEVVKYVGRRFLYVPALYTMICLAGEFFKYVFKIKD